MNRTTPYSEIKAEIYKRYGSDLTGMPACLDGVHKYYKDPVHTAKLYFDLVDTELERIKGAAKNSDISHQAKRAKFELLLLLQDLENTEGWNVTQEELTDRALKEMAHNEN